MALPVKVRPAPPKSEPKKALQINADYEAKAKALLRRAIQDRGSDYATLRDRLAAMGIEMTEGALQNKIARGGFSAAFLLQCLDALEATLADLQ